MEAGTSAAVSPCLRFGRRHRIGERRRHLGGLSAGRPVLRPKHAVAAHDAVADRRSYIPLVMWTA